MLEVKFNVYEFMGGDPDDFDNWGLWRSFDDRDEAMREANQRALNRDERCKVMMVVYQEIHMA